MIQQVLEEVRWNRVEAARRLKISYKALLYKIRMYDLGTAPAGKSGNRAMVRAHLLRRRPATGRST